MRVGLVCHRYPPFVGGLERHVYNLVHGLRETGIETTVFTTQLPQKANSDEDIFEFRAIQLPAGGYYFWPRFLSSRTLRKIRDMDIIHSFSATMFAPLATLAWSRLLRVPSVLTATYHPIQFTPHTRARGVYDSVTLKRIVKGHDRIIVHSDVELEALEDAVPSFDHGRTRKIEHASDILSVRKSSLELRKRFGQDSKLILIVGRIDYFKGFDEVVEAVRSLRRQDVNATLVHVGPRENWYSEASHIDSNNNEFIHSLGHVPEAALAAADAECDVTVVPSRFEAFGFVAVESLLLGTPVISTPTGIMREIIKDGKNGTLYQPGDVNSLTSKLNHYLSQTSRDTTIKAPLISVEKYGNPRREIDDLMSVYKEIARRGCWS